MATARPPDGPRSALPQLFASADPFPFMRSLAERYADPVLCPILGVGPVLITWSPEGLRELFTAPPETFAPATNEALAVIVGRGSIFLLAGEDHQRARRLLAPPFHGERMRAYGRCMQEATLRRLGQVEVGTRGPVLPLAQGITLDVIIEAIFGEADPERIALLHRDIVGLVEAFNPLVATFRVLQRDLFGFGPWARLQRQAAALHARMRALVEEKRAAPGEDVLSLLLSARHEDGSPLGDQELMEQLFTFVIAGHETTATTLAWALYELHRAPTTLADLRRALADCAGPEALAAQPLLEATVNEVLRLHPPVPVVQRRLLAPLSIRGHERPAGSLVAAGVYNAHMRPESWPAPAQFRPARFLERTWSPFEYLPFGGGARRCLGAAFATAELKIVLGTLLQHASFELEEPAPVPAVYRIGTYGPKTGVRMRRLA